MVRLTIVLPALNEEKNIEKTVRDVLSWMQDRSLEGEVVVVDDGSADETAAILSSLASSFSTLRVIRFEKNKGYGTAVRTGCDAATTDTIGFMDSDGQFDPHDFDRLLPALDRVPFVTGRRRKRADPMVRKMNAKLFGFLSWVVLGIWVRDVNCAMKVFRRDVWQKVRPVHATGALFNAELFLNLKENGIPWEQVDVPHYPRKFGAQTGAKISVVLRMFRELIALKRAHLKRS